MTGKLKKNKRQIWLLVAVLLLIAGTYLLITALAPAVPPQRQPESIYTNTTGQSIEIIKENRLYIPAISVDVAINEGTAAVLEKGAWHRKPENGNPEKGGNFVVSAHRFELGLTPQQTQTESPFYHIDRLQTGDRLFVDYNQKRYTYEVTKKYKVDRNAIQIEAPSAEPKMTLYSCDLRGEAAGREVIEARQITQD